MKPDEIATHPEKAPAHMAGAVLAVNEQMERIVEVALVLVIAAALSPQYLRIDEMWFIAVLFLVIRPIAVHIGLLRQENHHLRAPTDFMVWDPRYWIALLPHVCGQSGIA